MKVLITGANGYIGTRLLPLLVEKGHEVICLVRDKRRLKETSAFADRVTIIAADLLKETSIETFPPDIDAAYYLAHYLTGTPEFSRMEALSAHHFVQALNRTNCKQVIFLPSITHTDNHPQHPGVRKPEAILGEAKAALTTLHTSVIIGPGSLWFGVIHNLVEKLPIIIVPGWLKSRCQPIAISDVLGYLEGVLLNKKAFNQTLDIGGADILSFKDLLLTYSKVRDLKRKIIVLPFPSTKISACWLHLFTSTGYNLSQSLVNCIKSEAVMGDNRIDGIVPRRCLTCAEALTLSIAGTG